MDTNVIENAADGAKDHRWRRNITGIIAVIVVSVCALAVWGIFQFAQSQQLSQEAQQLAHEQAQAAIAGQQLAAQLKGLGVKPAVTPPTPVTGAQGVPGVPGPGPSQAEIDGAVSRYFAAHPLPPGQLPPVSEVAGLVAQYLITNPPAPGQNATPQMVSDAVTTYCAGHNGCAGPAGQDATDQQVAQQVSAYCATHGDCAGAPGQNGKDGATGPQGVSITDLVFQRDSTGTCQAIVTLHDPATNTDNTVSHPAGDAACPLLSKPLVPTK